jgi:hypothetical protein
MPPLPFSLFPAGWRAVVAGQSAGSFEGHPDTSPTTGLVRRTGCVFGRNRIARGAGLHFCAIFPVLRPRS